MMLRTAMWVAAVMAAGQIQAQPMRTQGPCPVMLVSGSADRDSVQLSFRNKGKAPIQQLSLGCSPPPQGSSRDAICHTESGLFYPGQSYSIDFAYAGGNTRSRTIVISAKAARLGDGSMWMARNAAACRPLRVPRAR